jgi:TetR/AcrR family transcriptional repressor of nem operon
MTFIAQASERAMARAATNWRTVVAGSPDDPYAALLKHYLSQRHRDDPAHGCAFAATPHVAESQSVMHLHRDWDRSLTF